MMDRTWRIHTIVLSVILGLSSLLALVSLPEDISAYVPHDPIYITGNQYFIPAKGVVGGSGTPSDPYIIEGWDIDASFLTGIYISDTDAYFIIRDVYVHSGAASYCSGIILLRVANGRVENATIVDNYDGVSVSSSAHITIVGNNVSSNNGSGIGISSSTEVAVISNNASSNRWHGIGVGGSDNVSVASNYVFSNFEGVHFMSSTNATFIANSVVSNLVFGAWFQYSSNLTIAANDVFNSEGDGIWLSSSANAMVTANDVLSNLDGISLSSSDNVAVTANHVSNNMSGIELFDATNITIAANDVSSNWLGIELISSDNVTVYHNNIVENVEQAFDNRASENTWDDGYPSGGNYWSDYGGPDVCSGPNQDICPDPDGIGDVPYVIDFDSRDRYPLMSPATLPQPDLAVSSSDLSFSQPPPLEEGSTVSVRARIWNHGSASSWPTVARFHDGVPPSSQIGLDQSLASIPAGGSVNASVSWIPLTAGNHDICVVVDPENLVTETSEVNNIACVSVLVLALPDLVPTSLLATPPSPLPEGTSASVNVTVANTGDLPAGALDVLLFDDLNGNLTPDQGEDIGVQALAGISGHSQSYATFAWTASPVGTHTLCAYVDSPPGAVNESNETNNIACTNMEVIFVRQLTPGHWFVSFPTVVANDSVDSVLSSISGCYDYVRWYDPLDATSHWKSYVPGRASNSLLRLDNTMGFWISITSNCSFAPGGTNPSSTTINLRQGWNMVGFPSFNTSYTVADLKADVGVPGILVEAYDASAAPYYLQRVSDDYVMMVGEGYWIYVPSDTAWIVAT